VPLEWADEWNEEGKMGKNRVNDLQMKTIRNKGTDSALNLKLTLQQ
jgi:hypothetical protein